MVHVSGTIDDLRAAIAMTLTHCIREGRGEALRPLLIQALAELDEMKVECDSASQATR